MSTVSTKDIVDDFTRRLAAFLDPPKLDGPVRLDNTHTVVIIPLKGRGPIHVHLQAGLASDAVDNILQQIRSVPSLKGLIREP